MAGSSSVYASVLDDAAYEPPAVGLVDEERAEEVAGDRERGAGEERAGGSGRGHGL